MQPCFVMSVVCHDVEDVAEPLLFKGRDFAKTDIEPAV